MPGSELAGRVAVISGAGRGIGAALACDLAQRGCRIAVYSRSEAEVEAVLAAARAAGSDGIACTVDARNRDQVRAFANRVIEHFGGVDILVNNVGGYVAQQADTDPDDGFVADLELNLLSALWLTRSLLPAMEQAHFGRIVNIGSGASRYSGGSLAYVTAKHALVGFTRQLAADVARAGITVNCLCPGWTHTSAIDWHLLGQVMGTDAAGARAVAESDNLQGRVLEPEELCAMAALLVAPSNTAITGQVIGVDGGYKV